MQVQHHKTPDWIEEKYMLDTVKKRFFAETWVAVGLVLIQPTTSLQEIPAHRKLCEIEKFPHSKRKNVQNAFDIISQWYYIKVVHIGIWEHETAALEQKKKLLSMYS